MRKFLLAVALLLITSQGAYATTNDEPFGLPFLYAAPHWRTALPERFEHQDKALIASIAEEVKRKPEKDWLTWTNQLVNLQVGKLIRIDNCTDIAVAKFEVLRKLGFDEDDLLFVVGRNAFDPKTKDLHAMLAVRIDGAWSMLDNGSYTPGYRVLGDSKVTKRFLPLYIVR